MYLVSTNLQQYDSLGAQNSYYPGTPCTYFVVQCKRLEYSKAHLPTFNIRFQSIVGRQSLLKLWPPQIFKSFLRPHCQPVWPVAVEILTHNNLTRKRKLSIFFLQNKLYCSIFFYSAVNSIRNTMLYRQTFLLLGPPCDKRMCPRFGGPCVEASNSPIFSREKGSRPLQRPLRPLTSSFCSSMTSVMEYQYGVKFRYSEKATQIWPIFHSSFDNTLQRQIISGRWAKLLRSSKNI